MCTLYTLTMDWIAYGLYIDVGLRYVNVLLVLAVKHKCTAMSYQRNGSGIQHIKMNKCYCLGTYWYLGLIIYLAFI